MAVFGLCGLSLCSGAPSTGFVTVSSYAALFCRMVFDASRPPSSSRGVGSFQIRLGGVRQRSASDLPVARQLVRGTRWTALPSQSACSCLCSRPWRSSGLRRSRTKLVAQSLARGDSPPLTASWDIGEPQRCFPRPEGVRASSTSPDLADDSPRMWSAPIPLLGRGIAVNWVFRLAPVATCSV
jgi:hypothetical protein